MNCQQCSRKAIIHITEVEGEGFQELHFCEECAQGYLYESQSHTPPIEALPMPKAAEGEEGELNHRECEICGTKFVEFRNTGRLGCPHDYQAFRNELTPLLESIHGQTRHCGKTPKRLPQARQSQQELSRLRKQLTRAVSEEAYEEAARIRDRIKELEGF